MDHRFQLIAITLVLFPALLAAGCKCADSSSPQETTSEEPVTAEPDLFPLELRSLERLRVEKDVPDASTPHYDRMNERQVAAAFAVLAPDNACAWSGSLSVQDGGESCTPMRMTCDLPHAFSVGDATTSIRLEVERSSCDSPFLLNEVRMRATGRNATNLVNVFKEHFGKAQSVSHEKNWTNYVWAGRGEALPRLVVMETRPR